MGEREILNKSTKFSWIWTSFDGWDDTKWKWREKNKSQGANNGEKEKTTPNFKLQYLRNQCHRGPEFFTVYRSSLV